MFVGLHVECLEHKTDKYMLSALDMDYLSFMPIVLRGTAPLNLIFEDFVYYFSKNKATLDKVPNGSD